jgi:hypothetical protein
MQIPGFGKKPDPKMGTKAFSNMSKENEAAWIAKKNKECEKLGFMGSTNGKTCYNLESIPNPMIKTLHSGGNVRRTGVYRVLSGEIVIPAKFRKGLGHKRIVALIAKKHQGPIPRTVKVGDSRGGRISKNGPMRLLKGDVVISRGQRKGLTFGQIINLIHG